MENIVILDYAASIRFHINTEGLHSEVTFIKAEIKVLDDTFLLLVITEQSDQIHIYLSWTRRKLL